MERSTIKPDGKLIGALLGLVLTRRPHGLLLGLLLGWVYDTLRARQRRADPAFRKVLNLNDNASPAQIEAAWRRLIAQHHPDRLIGSNAADRDAAAARAAAINAAYRGLRQRTPGKR
ncbi:MAG: DnaJ domain-containing protein [Lysobacteraceae bacterium]